MKYLKTLAIALALLIPSVSLAAPISWDFTSSILQPLRSAWGSEVKVHGITATSTTFENTFPRLNFTNATGTAATTTSFFSTLGNFTNLCIDSDCKTAWPGGISTATWPLVVSGTNISWDGIATSTEPTVGRLSYWTSGKALGDVATTTLTAGTGISSSASHGYLVGGSNTTFSIDQTFSPTWTGTHIFDDITRSTTTQATTTNFAILGILSKLLITGADGSVGAYTGTSCTNQFIRSLSALGVATCASVNLSSDVTGTLSAGSYGAATIDGDDINSNIAGRSLTLTSGSPDTLDIDSEIYTFSVAANLHATTTADGIATTTEKFLSVKIPVASTVTAIDCFAADTGTSTVKASYTSNPLSAGTQIVTAGTTCGSQALTNVTSFNNSAISAGDWLNVWVSDAEPTGSRPRVIYFTLTLTKND